MPSYKRTKKSTYQKFTKSFDNYVSLFNNYSSLFNKFLTPNKNISLEFLAFCFIFITLIGFVFRPKPQKIILNSQVLSETQDNELLKAKTFWESYLNSNPNYIDGWLELTRIEYELGDIKGAIMSLEKAKSINPNLSKVNETEIELGL